MANLLDKINSPKDLHQLSIAELKELAEELRQFITHTVSETGGHLASNLGIVELTIAMHYVFSFQSDHLLWDVGHQCYAHKIITGRKERFHLLRKAGGISGFPDPDENENDRFRVGHAGTSIATAIGMALGCGTGSDEKVVSVVGDASIVNGLSFEGLNNIGLVKRQMLIVLNDNSMAIDVTQGALAEFLAKVRLNHNYEDIRDITHNILKHVPLIGESVDHALENFKRTLRMAISPSRLFESLEIPYFGPVDGHDIGALIQLFRALSELDTPAMLHVYTKKGKGFEPADDNPRKFHSTGPFEIKSADSEPVKNGVSFTDCFSEAVVDLAEKDENITAITAAMPDGTGLVKFRDKFSDRFFDVGIAESAAVDIAAGMAKKNIKPLVCIYSTFLQRSYDQIFQEVGLAGLPVVFCVDRAGLVGNDGPTHHGLMDIAFMRTIPRVAVCGPGWAEQIRPALEFSLNCGKSVSIRYPRGKAQHVPKEYAEKALQPYEYGRSVFIKEGKDVLIAAFGAVLPQAVRACEVLCEEGFNVGIADARFAAPIDDKLVETARKLKAIVTVEDHFIAGGFGSALMEAVSADYKNNGSLYSRQGPASIINIGCPNGYIKSDTRARQLKHCGLDSDGIAETVRSVLQNIKNHQNVASGVES
jgi:1-deoxy-D-xylulose-5-phosphate synthase